MKKNKIIILFAFFYVLKSQNHVLFLSEFKKICKPKSNSFFVIQCKTNIELYTNAPAIIRRYREIRSHQICPYVYFICYDGAGVGDSIYAYFKKNFYVDTNEFTKIFLNKKLYSLLGDVKNSRVIYFNNNKVYEILDGKYDNVKNTFQYDFLKIKNKKYYSWDKKYGLHTVSSRYYPINDTLSVELADSQEDRIRLTNIRNGKILNTFPLYHKINYQDVIYKKFNLESKIDFKSVKKMDSIFKDLKRTPLRIENVYVKNKDSIFLIGYVTYFYFPAENDFYIPGDYWLTKKVRKGEITNKDFGIILLTNSNFEIKDTFFLNPFDNLFKTKFVTYANGFFPYINKFYFSCYNFNSQTDSTYKLFYENNKNTQILLSMIADKNKILKLNKIHSPLNKQPFENFFGYEDFRIWGTNRENVYITNSIFPEIYHKDYDTSYLKVVYDNNIHKEYKLHEMYKDYNANFDDKIPFSIIDHYITHDGKFLFLFYFFRSKVFINVYLPNMKLIQTIEITNYLNSEILKKMFDYEISTYVTEKRIVFAYTGYQEKYSFIELEYDLERYNKRYFDLNNELFIK